MRGFPKEAPSPRPTDTRQRPAGALISFCHYMKKGDDLQIRRLGIRPALILLALVAPASDAASSVFKCQRGSLIAYQDLPCEQGRSLGIAPAEPDRAARAAARLRAQKEERFVNGVERERDATLREARAERELREKERSEHERKCAAFLDAAEQAEADARTHVRRTRYKRDHERRARELRDRYFTECFAVR